MRKIEVMAAHLEGFCQFHFLAAERSPFSFFPAGESEIYNSLSGKQLGSTGRLMLGSSESECPSSLPGPEPPLQGEGLVNFSFSHEGEREIMSLLSRQLAN